MRQAFSLNSLHSHPTKKTRPGEVALGVKGDSIRGIRGPGKSGGGWLANMKPLSTTYCAVQWTGHKSLPSEGQRESLGAKLSGTFQHLIAPCPLNSVRQVAENICMKNLTLIPALFLLVSCGETMAFRDASKEDTIPAYRDYLEKYPDGSHTDSAYKRVEEIYYADAVKEKKPESLDRYLREYPKGEHVKDALNERRKLAYDQARGEDTPQAYNAFLRENPEGTLAVSSRERLEELSFRDAAHQDTPVAYRIYIQLFPAGRHHEEALSALARVSYFEAAQVDTPERYEQFLKNHGDSTFADLARQRLQLIQK